MAATNPLNAARLRSLTVGQVLAVSPVVFCDEAGNRFEVVTHMVTCKSAEGDGGKKVAADVPVLTLVIRQVTGVPS